MSPQALLKFALAVFGTAFLLIYPLAIMWPSGWAWHAGAPHDSQYFMMIVGVYVTLGVFLLNAARDPQAHRSLIWFTAWSSVVHAGIMADSRCPPSTRSPVRRRARSLPRRGRARRFARMVGWWGKGRRRGSLDPEHRPELMAVIDG